jgi:uncharacterized protein
MRIASRRAIGVVGKAPEPGTVKTRLSPPLDPQRAALLHGAFLRDALLRALTIRGASVSLVHPRGSDQHVLASLLPDGVACIEETGSNLGHTMDEAFRSLFARGAAVAVLTGADLPTLPASRIDEAFVALEQGTCDVVLGPAEDGGYYLIGLRAPQPILFERVDWSTDRTLAQTLDRAREAELRVSLLAPWYDVDCPDDLERLRRELTDDPDLDAPTTRLVLPAIMADSPLASSIP